MEVNSKKQTLQEDTNNLFFLLGRSMWVIQHLEDALSASIAMKNPNANNRESGDKIRNKNRELTLGKAIKLAKKEKVYEAALQSRLENFLDERNWLIHKCMRESVDDRGLPLDKDKLFKKVHDIGLMALSLKESIEIDMIEFSASKGRGDIRETMKQEYIRWIEECR